MCKVILPIRPKYVEEILNGTKKYEYRKKVFKNKNVKQILIYSTSPIKKVVAEVELLGTIIDSPKNIWEKTSAYSGIDLESFENYYLNKDIAVAYELGQVKVFKTSHNLEDYGIKYSPQSYVYVDCE